MTLLNYLLGRKKKSATVAKERLQIILAREHADQMGKMSMVGFGLFEVLTPLLDLPAVPDLERKQLFPGGASKLATRSAQT